MAEAEVTLTHHTAEEAPALLDELCDAYADAYGVEPSVEKTAAFRARAVKALSLDGYDLVIARSGNHGPVRGFAFGYSVPARGPWWENLDPDPGEDFKHETGSRTVLLAELEVRRAWQKKGLGRKLHDEFLAGRSEERATLSSNPESDDVRALYERWGWRRLGRRSRRPGDYLAAYDIWLLPLDDIDRR
jgi:ribosomal protein S18 acetylase RimI-like enzyme